MNRLVDESAEATSPVEFSPGTLGFALQMEAQGAGSVRFVGGVPVWTADDIRFPEVRE